MITQETQAKGLIPIEGVKVQNNRNVGQETNRFISDRNNRQFMVKTMDQAIERFNDNLQRIEREKQMQHEDHDWRVEAEKEIVNYEKQTQRELQARNYLELVKQIQNNKAKKEQESKDDKLPYLTNGGPGVSDEVVKELQIQKK